MRWYQRATEMWSKRSHTSGEPGFPQRGILLPPVLGLPTQPLLECSAVLEVVVPPSVPRLYFWALQASFSDGTPTPRRCPPRIAVEHQVPAVGRRPTGADTPRTGRCCRGPSPRCPSTRKDPNTRDYPWIAGHRYRLQDRPQRRDQRRHGRLAGNDHPHRVGRRGQGARSPHQGASTWSGRWCGRRCSPGASIPTTVVRWSDLRAIDGRRHGDSSSRRSGQLPVERRRRMRQHHRRRGRDRCSPGHQRPAASAPGRGAPGAGSRLRAFLSRSTARRPAARWRCGNARSRSRRRRCAGRAPPAAAHRDAAPTSDPGRSRMPRSDATRCATTCFRGAAHLLEQLAWTSSISHWSLSRFCTHSK